MSSTADRPFFPQGLPVFLFSSHHVTRHTSNSIPSHTRVFLVVVLVAQQNDPARDGFFPRDVDCRYWCFSPLRLDPWMFLFVCAHPPSARWGFMGRDGVLGAAGEHYGDYEDPAFGGGGGWGKTPGDEATAVPGAFVEANPETTDL